LGRTGLDVSELAVGTWQIGGARFGAVDAREACDLLRAAADRGVNLFDTSAVYGNGRAEVLLGRAFAGRDDVHVVTKTGYLVGVDGAQELFDEPPQHFARRDITTACETSLRRLGRDSVEVFLLHDPPREVLAGDEAWEALRALRRAGKARAVGVSTTARKVPLALAAGPDVIEVLFNRSRPELADDGHLRAAVDQGVGVIARSPLHNGSLLAGTTTPEERRAVVGGCLAYVLRHPVAAVALGIASPDELTADLDAYDDECTVAD
jgi:aryl-alcohol dehydrogenase-like predicted oxidoreductase